MYNVKISPASVVCENSPTPPSKQSVRLLCLQAPSSLAHRHHCRQKGCRQAHIHSTFYRTLTWGILCSSQRVLRRFHMVLWILVSRLCSPTHSLPPIHRFPSLLPQATPMAFRNN